MNAIPTLQPGWLGHLQLHYRLDARGGTSAHDRHDGPLRVLKRLYPEGPRVCHHVLVHPPGGIVGGDRLHVAARLDAGTHALVTTPGATRFYRSAGGEAAQSVSVSLAAGARLEWLPLETLAYRGCLARNEARFHLAAGAQMIGWDVTALGLPASGEPFTDGRFEQHLELPGAWLERGLIDAGDTRLLQSPLGLDGRRVIATLWFGGGTPLDAVLAARLLDDARAACEASPLALHAGATAPDPRVVVLRLLADRVEPAMALLTEVRARWRRAAWQLEPHPPRVWRT